MAEDEDRTEGMEEGARGGAAPRQGLLLGFSGFPVRAMAPGVARLARAIG